MPNTKKENVNKRYINFSTEDSTSTGANYPKQFISRDKTKKEIRERNWYVFVLSFLLNARNGCNLLIDSKRLDDNNKYLAISIIYNFRHSLEIFLKAFSRYLKEHLDKSDYIHDTRKLLEEFKRNLEKNNKKIKKEEKDKLTNEINKLEKIIEKYNEVNFLSKYLNGGFSICDYENTFFKYPENSATIDVDYSRLINQFKRSDMTEIKKDIETVIKISKKFKSILL